MNNHVHLIISSQQSRLEDIMRDMKKFTSGELIRAIESNPQESRKNWMLWLFRSAGEMNPNNKNYQFWQQDNHPIVLDKSAIIQQKLNYIHDNPIRAGLVYEPWQYPYSSALDYYGKGTGMLPLELLI